MTDAWSALVSGDINSYGLSGQISFTENVSSTAVGAVTAAVSSLCGNSIGDGFSAIGPIPQRTIQFSQAANLLSGGFVQTSLNNPDPIVFVSYDPNRSQMLNFMGAAGFPGLKLMNGQNEYGDNGWQVQDILAVLIGMGNGGSLSLSNSLQLYNMNYHIGYYRVEPYADIVGEFKKLYSGLPVIMQFDPLYMQYVPKLPPVCMFTTIDYSAQTNISIKFIPEKKVSVIVRGGLGRPDANSFWGSGSVINTSAACPGITFDSPFTAQWGQATPEGKIFKGAFAPQEDLIGEVSGSAKAEYITKLVTFTNTVDSGSALTKTFNLSGERFEVLSKIGTPISTLWSKSQRIHQNLGGSAGSTGMVAATTYQANQVKLFSHGESSLDIQAVVLVSRALTVSDVAQEGSPAQTYKMPMSYSIKFDLYEDIFSDTKSAISASTSQGMGRKMQEVNILYKPFTVTKAAWNAWSGPGTGNLIGVNALQSPHNFNEADKFLVMFEVSRTTKHFDPIGNSGYKSNSVTINTNPTANFAQDIDIVDAGDAASYSSITPIGPGYSRIIGKSASGGEPLFVSIPVCKKDEADDYAETIAEYHNGYYQVTKIHETPICGDSPNYSQYIGAFERPGTAGAYGLVVAVSQNITPFKCTTTTTYRYYAC